MNVATFFGHRNIFEKIDIKLYKNIELLIEIGVSEFMVGGHSEFDIKVCNIIKELKSANNKIKLILVYPYFSNKFNTNKDYYN